MCNVSLSVQQRVADLMMRLSRLNESYKFGQLNSWDGSFHVPQLAIPGYQWWNEALHGLGHSPGVHFHGKTPGATMFPEPSFTGCSFNTSLYRAIGMAIADDARGFNNNGNAGLTYWSPDVNVRLPGCLPASLHAASLGPWLAVSHCLPDWLRHPARALARAHEAVS